MSESESSGDAGWTTLRPKGARKRKLQKPKVGKRSNKKRKKINRVDFSFKDSLIFKRLIKIKLYKKICILFVGQLFGKVVGGREQSPPPRLISEPDVRRDRESKFHLP